MAEKQIKNIHFIGIGGVGMSGIALVAKAQGFNVSGSDLRKGTMTDILQKAGIEVSIGNRAENIAKGSKKPDIVIVSTAIMDTNAELNAAKDAKIKIWHRAQMLAYLGRNLKTLAVTGTHGKTSTSAMLASVLAEIGEDPSFLIGGVVREFGTNARSGKGPFYAVEADESDKSFTYLDPYAAIVTNIEQDHLDHYKDYDEIYEKFSDFISSLPNDGIAVVCGDDKKLLEIAKKSTNNVVSYGFEKNNDCIISKYKTVKTGCEFSVELSVFKNTKSIRDKKVKLQCALKQNPGKHYALNAASVICLLDALGYDAKIVAEALSKFAGAKRRFDLVGCENDITLIDDYAHHSTEIAATVKAACELDFKNVHVMWQPHRFSRINLFRDIYRDVFAHAFDGCATVTFTNVYGAGEVPIPGITGESFLNVIREEADKNTPKTYYVHHRLDLIDHIIKIAKPGDLIITMGAGDITSVGPQILETLKNKK